MCVDRNWDYGGRMRPLRASTVSGHRKRNSAFRTDTAVSPHADQIAQWDADDKLEERERIVDAVTPSK